MKLGIAGIALALPLLVSCLAPPVHPQDERAFARAALVSMAFGVQAVAISCTDAISENQRRHDIQSLERADRIGRTCARGLLPARDAIHYALERADPWSAESAPAIGCAGKTVRWAFTDIARRFAEEGTTPPELLEDGIRLGTWAEGFSSPQCDPLYPTTRIAVQRPDAK